MRVRHHPTTQLDHHNNVNLCKKICFCRSRVETTERSPISSTKRPLRPIHGLSESSCRLAEQHTVTDNTAKRLRGDCMFIFVRQLLRKLRPGRVMTNNSSASLYSDRHIAFSGISYQIRHWQWQLPMADLHLRRDVTRKWFQ